MEGFLGSYLLHTATIVAETRGNDAKLSHPGVQPTDTANYNCPSRLGSPSTIEGITDPGSGPGWPYRERKVVSVSLPAGRHTF